MRIQFARIGAKATAVAACGVVALGTVTATVAASAAAAGRPQVPAVATAAASSVPVVVNCAMRGRVRPSQYVLACADGNSSLTGLHWQTWGSSSALAQGRSTFNDCIPNCVSGHFHSFPALAALWRVRPWPGHAGQRYFTRVTIIYTGRRSYRAGGKTHHLPVTSTEPLSAGGGA
jgi:hypothetical protein